MKRQKRERVGEDKVMTQQANGYENRYTLRNRYQFTGQLIMQTALHIGGGKVTLSSSDSPIVLTPERVPFIPGSSFKGALRSTVEKLVPSLPESANLYSCGLIEQVDEKQQAQLQHGRKPCPTIRQRSIARERRNNPGRAEQIVEDELKNLCNTCQLFGSPFAASRINVNDLYMPDKEWGGIIQVRDGVAIDRDSERAKDRLKYDFEVVPASAIFDLKITLENATEQDLQILCVGLSEFVHGFGVIGGKRSRGLGACSLKDLQVSFLNLENQQGEERNRHLRNFLLRGDFPSGEPGETFLEKYISRIFQ
jgi:CRISPR-associated RAMP protein (TIGR02581 family)